MSLENLNWCFKMWHDRVSDHPCSVFKVTVSTHLLMPLMFQDLDTRLKKLTRSAPCILFMKGSPQDPRCGKMRSDR